MIIDSHAHLNDEKLFPLAEEIHAGLEKNGLSAVVNVGYDEESCLKCVALAEQYRKFYAVVGMHPHDSRLADNAFYDLLTRLSEGKKVLAIGEIGLDYYYDLSPRETQKKVFLEQLELARALKKPVVIHLRDAYGDMYKLLKENRPLSEYGFLLHCYSGSKEMLAEFAKMGAYFSFGGAVTFKNAVDKPDVVRSAPTDRLLLETDCPYMTPVPFRGKPNRPEYIVYTAEKIASFLGKDREEIEDITLKNTKEFFKKINDSL